MVSASLADAATSMCTLVLLGVPPNVLCGLGDAPAGALPLGTIAFADPASNCEEPLEVTGRFPPDEASLPDTTSERLLPRLDAAAFNLDMSPLRFTRPGMAIARESFVTSCAPPSPPADPPVMPDAAELLKVKGVDEDGVDDAIAGVGRATADNLWEPGYPGIPCRWLM